MRAERVARRLPHPDQREDGAALLLALLVIMIAGVLTLAVAGTVLVQTKPTQADRKTNRTLSAAEAGFDAALSRIRAARDTTSGLGKLSSLPCTAGGVTFAGPVSSNPGALNYSVTIRYYATNPAAESKTWQNQTSNQISCTGGHPTAVPAYALLTSKGSGSDVPGSMAGAGNRTLSTVYTFETTNENIAGGLIHLYNQDTPQCLDVDSTTNVPGKDDKLTIAACDATRRGQNWVYTPDLLLQVAGTNLCLEAVSTTNRFVTLQPCDTEKREQKWSFNDVGRFEGAAGTGNVNGWCFTAEHAPAVNGDRVKMQSECSGGYDYVHTFSPEAKVGAGAAGEDVGNLVNYRYFGHCLDVTSQNVNAKWLIGYPCKQTPDPKFLTWNQVFTYQSASKQYKTTPPAGAYCLQVGSNASPPTVGTRALVKPCNTGEVYQQWTPTRSTRVYTTSYNVVSKNGLCLSLVDGPGLGEPGNTDYLNQWGMVIVETCNGSLEQKWNAPANIVTPGLDDTQESTGG